jgi:hypothetical protein
MRMGTTVGNSKGGERLLCWAREGARDGGQNELLILLCIFGESNSCGGFVTTSAEGGGDGVYIHFSFAAEADAEPSIGHEFK